MHPHVSFQVGFVTERLITHGAFIRFFTCMCSGVPFQSRVGSKFFLAVGTLEGPFPRVHSQMILESRRIRKLFTALVASVRLLTGVDSHVLLHVHTGAEAFPAGATFVRLFPSVNPGVQVEIITSVEPVSTDVALEGFLG